MKKLFLSLNIALCTGVLLFSCGPMTTQRNTSGSSGATTTTSGSPFVQPATTAGAGGTTTTTTTPTPSSQVLKTFSTTMWVVGSAAGKTVIANVVLEVVVHKTPLTNYVSHTGIASFAGIRNTYNGKFMESTPNVADYGFMNYESRLLSGSRTAQYFRSGSAPPAEYNFTCVQDLSKVDQKGQRLFMNRVALQTQPFVPATSTSAAIPAQWERTEITLRFLNSRTGIELFKTSLRGDVAEDSPYIRIACSEFEL